MGLLARQRAIEVGEEATGLLWVSVEVVPQRRVELGPSLVWVSRSGSGGGGRVSGAASDLRVAGGALGGDHVINAFAITFGDRWPETY
jgi:hypothetical protein